MAALLSLVGVSVCVPLCVQLISKTTARGDHALKSTTDTLVVCCV